jgi:hypothetical protein
LALGERAVLTAGFADLVGVVFFIAAFCAFGAAAFGMAATFFGALEAFAEAFELLAEAFLARLTLAALGAAFALDCGVPVGIMLPTARMAFEPASITTPAADVAASPIRSMTPFDFFLRAIECSVSG